MLCRNRNTRNGESLKVLIHGPKASCLWHFSPQPFLVQLNCFLIFIEQRHTGLSSFIDNPYEILNATYITTAVLCCAKYIKILVFIEEPVFR